ncbi:MAG: endolytic transglycosylase MltG [Candidatus Limnocylindrales bacterium]
MSDPQDPRDAPSRRPMATPIGEQRGTVSRLELPRAARPAPPANGRAGDDWPAGSGPDPFEPGAGGDGGRGTVRAGQRPRNGGQRRRLGAGIVLAGLLALAALIVIGGLTLARPAVAGLARSMAEDNPQTLKLPFVADLVRGQLGAALTGPAGTDATPVDFVVASGATARQVAEALTAQDLISDPLVFEFLTVTSDQAGTIRAGDYTLTQLMTPPQILDRLQQPPDPRITLALRPGLRIEQIAAYLETRGLGATVAQDVYGLAEHPPAALRADYPFLAALPAGRSLEGFLGSATWQVKPTVTGEAIVRHLLTAWATAMGPAIVSQATSDGPAFYRALVLASIVEQEAALDSERPLIAGVYTNRLDPKVWPTGLLNADPTVFYAHDAVALADLAFGQWQTYYFWKPVTSPLASLTVPKELISFQTYTHPGPPAWPICSPTAASVQAALDPDTATGYLYFVAKGDGSDSHAFAKTNAQFQQLLKQYGYIK